MGKSIRSKREKRLRAIRREIVEPLYQKKEDAKLAVQEAAFNAPKLPVREIKTTTSAAMEIVATAYSANRTDSGIFFFLPLPCPSGVDTSLLYVFFGMLFIFHSLCFFRSSSFIV